MPHIIFIYGPLGSGKSTITPHIKKQFKEYAYVDVPNTKKGLRPIGSQESRRLAAKIASYTVSELVNKQKNIIIEELGPSALNKLLGENYFQEHNYTISSVYLTCDVETAIQRNYNRGGKTSEERIREIHKRVSPLNTDIVIETDKLSLEESLQKILAGLHIPLS